MATKTSFLLLLSILLLSTTIALSSRREDEREKDLQQCREQCQQQPHYDQGMRRQCEKHCEERQREREEKEREDESRRQDPEEKLQECQDRCSLRRGGQKQCRSQCEEKFQEDQRREQQEERGQGRDDDDDSSQRDPKKRLEECRHQCRQGRQGREQQWKCQQKCQEKYEEERGQGTNPQREDPKERLEECRQQCQQGQQQSRCERQCEDRYRQEKREQEGSNSGEEEEEKGRSQRNNPYVFKRESFIHRVRTQHGSIRLLKNFLQKSKLLLGIANYRLVIFEANPRTFAVPKYSDADQLFFVANGEGTVTLVRVNEEEESHNVRRESHKVRQGDIIRVHAGTVVYIINNSNNQKLQIVKLVQPVSTPGRFEDFYVGGGENPETVYRTFSTSVLEAALNTQQAKLDRLFGRQKQGVIVEASEEQIRGMSRHTEGGSPWPFGGQSSKKTFNLLNKRPDHSNERGKLYTADSNDYQELRDIDVHVAFANITRGSMMAPFFESKATKISIVVDGSGEFEMVCPHLSRKSQSKGRGGEESEQQEEEEESEQQQQGRKQSHGGEESEQEEEEEGGQSYQKVRSRLTKGTVFVVPAGHPTAIIASKDENLQVVCFEVHAKNSRKVFLAGKNNVVSELEREAKELAFGVPARLVDEVFGGSRDEVFVRAPEEGRRQPLQSILEFPDF